MVTPPHPTAAAPKTFGYCLEDSGRLFTWFRAQVCLPQKMGNSIVSWTPAVGRDEETLCLGLFPRRHASHTPAALRQCSPKSCWRRGTFPPRKPTDPLLCIHPRSTIFLFVVFSSWPLSKKKTIPSSKGDLEIVIPKTQGEGYLWATLSLVLQPWCQGEEHTKVWPLF